MTLSRPVADPAGINNPHPARWPLVDLLTVLAVTLLVSAPSFFRPLELQDEQLIVVYADQIRDGRLPHLDFFTVYGPGTFLLVAAGFIVGATTEIERLVGLGYHLALVLGMMSLARSYGRRPALIAGLVCALALTPLDLIAYAWLGGLALIVLQVVLLANGGSPWASAAAGALAGLVPFWRPEMLAIAVIVAVPLVWRRQWKAFLGGLVVGLIPISWFLVSAGALLWDNVVVSRLVANAQLDLASLSGAALVGLALTCTATATVVTAAIRSRDRTLASMALLAITLLPQTLQRVDVDHVAFSLCVTGPSAVIALASGRARAIAPPRRAWVGEAVIVTGVVILALASFLQRPIAQSAWFSAEGRSMPIAADTVDETRALVDLVQRTSPPGSRLFVGAKDMSRPTLSRVSLYHLLPEYVPASYFIELPPGVAEREGSRLPSDLLTADVLILTAVPADLNTRLFPNFPPGAQDANRVVSEHFCAVGSNPLGDVYRRCR